MGGEGLREACAASYSSGRNDRDAVQLTTSGRYLVSSAVHVNVLYRVDSTSSGALEKVHKSFLVDVRQFEALAR